MYTTQDISTFEAQAGHQVHRKRQVTTEESDESYADEFEAQGPAGTGWGVRKLGAVVFLEHDWTNSGMMMDDDGSIMNL